MKSTRYKNIHNKTNCPVTAKSPDHYSLRCYF